MISLNFFLLNGRIYARGTHNCSDVISLLFRGVQMKMNVHFSSANGKLKWKGIQVKSKVSGSILRGNMMMTVRNGPHSQWGSEGDNQFTAHTRQTWNRLTCTGVSQWCSTFFPRTSLCEEAEWQIRILSNHHGEKIIIGLLTQLSLPQRYIRHLAVTEHLLISSKIAQAPENDCYDRN